MAMVIVSVIVSLIALVVFCVMAKSRRGVGQIYIASLFGVFLSALFLASPVVLAQMLMSFVLSLVGFALKFSRMAVTILMVFSAVIPYLFVVKGVRDEMRECELLREELPLQSIAGRLKYERQRNSTPPVAASQFSREVENQLDHVGYRGFQNRAAVLQVVHNRTLEGFLVAQGFGSMRMVAIRVRRDRVDVPDPGQISLQSASAFLPPDAVPPSSRPERKRLLALHWAGLEDFLDVGRIGYVQDRDHVAGFLSHRFERIPKPELESGTNQWDISRLDLISILKHDDPKAYVSEHLPRMDELLDAPVRDLNDFEATALARLRSQEDLVIDDRRDRIRMVGSLRAGNDCLQCHQASRGELLGALSYELAPVLERDNKAGHSLP